MDLRTGVGTPRKHRHRNPFPTMVSREHPPIRATIITTTAAAYSITTEWEMEEEQEVEEEAVAARSRTSSYTRTLALAQINI